MKKIYSYMVLCVWACVALCCSDEELGSSQILVKTGDDVRFGVSVAASASRTIYGAETATSFPINWVNGDTVQVISPQCLAGRNNAKYKVYVDKNKNIADSLVKVGQAGVQWGTEELANFYSVYPSGQYEVDENLKLIKNLKINEHQVFDVPVNKICEPDMTACLMFAQKEEAKKGDVVELTYSPIATSIRLTLKTAGNENPDYAVKEFQIQAVRLSAYNEKGEAVNIVGTFNYDFANDTVKTWVKNAAGKDVATNSVVANIYDSNVNYTMEMGETLTLPLFIAPVNNLNIKKWVVEVYTDKKRFTKTIEEDRKIVPHQVHKLTLPTLGTNSSNDWSVSDWMVNIPRNVYLSEVSIPGSWNSLNPDFQGASPTIKAQYEKGIRAFHFDTRWGTTNKPGHVLGLRDPYHEPDELNSNNMYLSVADGNGGNHVRKGYLSTSLGQVMKQNNLSFAEYLTHVTDSIKDEEYGVVFCTFAHDSYNDTSKTGMTWMQAISNACANNGDVFDGKLVDSNTVVQDVLGKVIVVVNCADTIKNLTLPANSKCLFTHVSMKLSSADFPAKGFKEEKLYSSSSSSITMAASHAQVTSVANTGLTNSDRGYYPLYKERDTIATRIWDWSKSNYPRTDYKHDKWIYLGLGGSTASSGSSEGDDNTSNNVANHFYPIIDARLAEMGKDDDHPYYPIGIVFQNNVTTNTNVTNTVKSILMLNNKYRLKYDSSKPAFPNATLSLLNYDAGMLGNKDAISTQ